MHQKLEVMTMTRRNMIVQNVGRGLVLATTGCDATCVDCGFTSSVLVCQKKSCPTYKITTYFTFVKFVKNKTTLKLLQPSIVETLKRSLHETVPKTINNTLKEVVNPVDAAPSSHSFSFSSNSPETTFIINGVPDLGESEIKQTEDDAVAFIKRNFQT